MKLPEFFRPIMWSWTFDEIDVDLMKNTITIQALNYGDLKHWRWVAENFGREVVKSVFDANKKTNMDKHNAELVELIFKFS